MKGNDSYMSCLWKKRSSGLRWGSWWGGNVLYMPRTTGRLRVNLQGYPQRGVYRYLLMSLSQNLRKTRPVFYGSTISCSHVQSAIKIPLILRANSSKNDQGTHETMYHPVPWYGQFQFASNYNLHGSLWFHHIGIHCRWVTLNHQDYLFFLRVPAV